MAGFTLADMRRFWESGKKKQGSQRDKLVRDGNKVIYYLWGNKIAEVEIGSEELWISDANYRSQLTKDRLNKVLPTGHSISQKQREWFLDGQPFSGEATVRI